MTRNRILVALLGLTLAASFAPVGSGDAGHAPKITVVAGSQGGCPGGETWCWNVQVDGELTPGASVEVTVQVPEDIETGGAHSFYVASSGFDEGGNSAPSNAIAGTEEPLVPGEEVTFTFTIPEDASALYGWCDEGAHEQLGMWHSFELSGAGNGADGESDDGNTSSAPGLGLIAALAGLGVAAFALSRRR